MVINNMILYIVFYSNQVGLFYDLILGPDMLLNIFNEFFSDFVFVPKDKMDQDYLFSFIGDLHNNYFILDHELLNTYEYKYIIINIYENYHEIRNIIIKIQKYSKTFRKMINLILCYIPLIGIVTDNLQLSPLNLQSESLPAFNESDFIFTKECYVNGNFYCLYKKTFEIYLFMDAYGNSDEEYKIKKQFYEKLYSKCNDSFILPCYGYFEESKKFLFKFVIKKKNEFIHLTDTEKSELIFKFLGCVVTFQEFGFSKRAL